MRYAGCYSISAVAAAAGVSEHDVVNAILDAVLTYDKKLDFIREDAKMIQYVNAKGVYDISKRVCISGSTRIGVYSNCRIAYKSIGTSYHAAIIRSSLKDKPLYKTIIGKDAKKVVEDAIEYCINRTDLAIKSHKSEGKGYSINCSFTYNELLFMRDVFINNPRLLSKINKYITKAIRKREKHERNDGNQHNIDGNKPAAEDNR